MSTWLTYLIPIGIAALYAFESDAQHIHSHSNQYSGPVFVDLKLYDSDCTACFTDFSKELSAMQGVKGVWLFEQDAFVLFSFASKYWIKRKTLERMVTKAHLKLEWVDYCIPMEEEIEAKDW